MKARLLDVPGGVCMRQDQVFGDTQGKQGEFLVRSFNRFSEPTDLSPALMLASAPHPQKVSPVQILHSLLATINFQLASPIHEEHVRSAI